MGSPKGTRRLKAVSAPPQGLRLDTVEGAPAMGQFSALLDRGFGLRAPARFLDFFPIWDERLGPDRERAIRLGVWDGGSLVSCAGVRLAELHVTGGALPVALIGAVATDAAYRGRGLASRTVELAVEWARERGAALAMLWGSESAMYERLGFEWCGTQVRAALAELDLGPGVRDYSGVILGRGWIPTLMDCLRRRGSGLKLDASDERWMEAHQGVDWYWLGEPEAPRAYAALGRGIDLQGIVHEWGGQDLEALRLLLRLVRMEHPEAQLLASPELLRAWGLGSSIAPLEPLCMARVFDAGAAARASGSLWIWGLDAV